ncbi:MAG: hypothetical protein WCD35_19560 [Mycobacteriales bacterium]
MTSDRTHDGTDESAGAAKNATAGRMAKQAQEGTAATLDDIATEVADELPGADPGTVEAEVQRRWAERAGEAAAPLPQDLAGTIAEHVSAGADVTVVPSVGAEAEPGGA